MTTGNDLIQRFEMFANPALAESWDHVGLQLGNPDRPAYRQLPQEFLSGSYPLYYLKRADTGIIQRQDIQRYHSEIQTNIDEF